MGGKGQRRRQKNFVASHGGDRRLPPPPKPRDVEALPSKLRLLMDLQAPPRSSDDPVEDTKRPNKKSVNSIDVSEKMKGTNRDFNNEESAKKKKNKKRKASFDPYLQKILGGERLTKRQRRKDYLDARKKKHKKPKEESIREFPGRENVRFGEVVDAPPKLPVPKAFKIPKDASRERLRLQAVEAYRKRKGWVSRPGVNPPSLE